MVLRVGDTSLNPQGNTILYAPTGTRYVFPDAAPPGTVYLQAASVIDRNGNRSEFSAANRRWTDTLGRTVEDPLPNPLNHEFAVPGTKEFTLPGYGAEHKIVWKKLQPDGCDTGSEPICEDSILENPSQQLKYLGNDTCQDAAAG